ncbi:hypothetical protein A2911_00485 [Candidatus Nomurabacteria bacterium RIFCSPLOWO2_01_FULL_40_15]|uniref:Uncharacterized protein n=1 Tax=Candidatus Nomurabacteria bacterium RIFCSPLOWO2_01_FULL_40_15 TaxID=1801772 RepID=A0A1F6X664_9BACT|nr:MAG: hypothetical protein A2911_00485 [Candidatus Nomurabacteria bacterium RIFCSPLOWO2_01_FULL_40_15]
MVIVFVICQWIVTVMLMMTGAQIRRSPLLVHEKPMDSPFKERVSDKSSQDRQRDNKQAVFLSFSIFAISL